MPKQILVESIDGKRAARIRCEKCGHERDLDLPDELNQEATWRCDACGQWAMTFKYEVAPRCKGCRRLGFWDVEGTGDGYCSRRCKLQHEYAAEIGKAA